MKSFTMIAAIAAASAFVRRAQAQLLGNVGSTVNGALNGSNGASASGGGSLGGLGNAAGSLLGQQGNVGGAIETVGNAAGAASVTRSVDLANGSASGNASVPTLV